MLQDGHDCMDAGGRATHDSREGGGRTNHDYRDIEGRVTPGAVTEETESRRPKPRINTKIVFTTIRSLSRDPLPKYFKSQMLIP